MEPDQPLVHGLQEGGVNLLHNVLQLVRVSCQVVNFNKGLKWRKVHSKISPVTFKVLYVAPLSAIENTQWGKLIVIFTPNMLKFYKYLDDSRVKNGQ